LKFVLGLRVRTSSRPPLSYAGSLPVCHIGPSDVTASEGIPDVAVARPSVNLAQKPSRNCRWNQWPWARELYSWSPAPGGKFQHRELSTSTAMTIYVDDSSYNFLIKCYITIKYLDTFIYLLILLMRSLLPALCDFKINHASLSYCVQYRKI